jgi:hypothetical protein
MAEAVINILKYRFGDSPLPPPVKKKVLACSDILTLESWIKAAATANFLDEAISIIENS